MSVDDLSALQMKFPQAFKWTAVSDVRAAIQSFA